ncbi:hypothetical protein HA466_0104700 [Hirschfeldia incana]|nr:hypothetical protein HA466_0104700 [Hirschfeldia incana]
MSLCRLGRELCTSAADTVKRPLFAAFPSVTMSLSSYGVLLRQAAMCLLRLELWLPLSLNQAVVNQLPRGLRWCPSSRYPLFVLLRHALQDLQPLRRKPPR